MPTRSEEYLCIRLLYLSICMYVCMYVCYAVSPISNLSLGRRTRSAPRPGRGVPAESTGRSCEERGGRTGNTDPLMHTYKHTYLKLTYMQHCLLHTYIHNTYIQATLLTTYIIHTCNTAHYIHTYIHTYSNTTSLAHTCIHTYIQTLVM